MGKTFKKNDRHVKFNKHDNKIPNRFKKIQNHHGFSSSNEFESDDDDIYEFDQDENN